MLGAKWIMRIYGLETLGNYNNKILISSPSFKIGTNVKVNINVKSKEVDNRRLMVRNEPDVKPKKEPDIKSNKEHKQDLKSNTELRKEDKQAVKMIKTEPNVNKITYEEENIALILGITSIFTVWWMFK